MCLFIASAFDLQLLSGSSRIYVIHCLVDLIVGVNPFTSLLFVKVKARFYTHLPEPSKKNVCLGRLLYNTLFWGIGKLIAVCNKDGDATFLG